MKTEKIYEVEFFHYTNYTKDAVSSTPGEATKDTKYLDTSSTPFLVRESDLHIFQKYGGGFRNLRYVGTLHIPDEKDLVSGIDSDVEISYISCPPDLSYDSTAFSPNYKFDYKLIADTEFQGT